MNTILQAISQHLKQQITTPNTTITNTESDKKAPKHTLASHDRITITHKAYFDLYTLQTITINQDQITIQTTHAINTISEATRTIALDLHQTDILEQIIEIIQKHQNKFTHHQKHETTSLDHSDIESAILAIDSSCTSNPNKPRIKGRRGSA